MDPSITEKRSKPAGRGDAIPSVTNRVRKQPRVFKGGEGAPRSGFTNCSTVQPHGGGARGPPLPAVPPSRQRVPPWPLPWRPRREERLLIRAADA